MTTMISSLPRDLVMEILSRVPLNSMREVRLTCKMWNDLSKTQSFRKMHIGKASSTGAKEGEYQMIVMIGYNLYLTSIFVRDGEPYFEHKGKLNEQVKVSEVYHCEGLLLCILQDDPRLLVWNPYLREKRWIQPRYFYPPDEWNMFTYALGYESSRNCCVKLLRFIDYYFREPEYQFFWYEMYDFESGLWTTLDVTPHWRIKLYNRGVSLKGNTYWCAAKRNLDINADDSIICFDFTSERFGQLLPLPFSAGLDDNVNLSCVGEEKLAVLLQHIEPYEQVFDIWITNKIKAQEVSWSKFLRVESQFGTIREGFFIDEEKKIAIVFKGSFHKRFTFNIIGDAGYLRELDILGEHADGICLSHACAYVPSLVQIEQLAGEGEKKQQSELENPRWDEYMSRLVQIEAIYHHPYSSRLVIAEENQ